MALGWHVLLWVPTLSRQHKQHVGMSGLGRARRKGADMTGAWVCHGASHVLRSDAG